MNLKRKIGVYSLIIGFLLVIIGVTFNLLQNDLTYKQTIGAYLTIFAAICTFASVTFYSNRKNINKK